MKRREDSQDDVRLVVTNLEEPALEEEVANEAAEADETSAPEAVPDDIPVAVTDEAERETARSGWRLFSSEDMPQVSLREILGGDYLLGSYLRRNIWFILLLVLLSILYISNRYASQQEIIEEEKLRKELVEKKNYALTQYAALTMASRQSSIERKLRQMGDSLLMSATEPPFIIRIKSDE